MSETIYFDTSKIVDTISKSFERGTQNVKYVEINEEVYELNNYLSLLYKNESEKYYIETLFKALELSYSNKLYQFAYIQLHMIFMVCIYYLLLQVNEVAPGEIENALYYMIKDKNRVRDFYGNSNTRNDKLYFGSFAVLGECDVFLLLKITGIDSDLQGELKKLVVERNNCAHANGNITITSQTTIDEKISKYINTMERIFNLLKPLVEELYRKTLTNPDFYDSENRSGYIDDNIQIQEEFIKKYSISQKELNVCRRVNINQFADETGFSDIKNLHIALCSYYKSLTEDAV